MNAISWMMTNRALALPEFTRPDGFDHCTDRASKMVMSYLRTMPAGADEEMIVEACGISRTLVRRGLVDLLGVSIERWKKVGNGRYWYRVKGSV